jgi:aspartate racemase
MEEFNFMKRRIFLESVMLMTGVTKGILAEGSSLRSISKMRSVGLIGGTSWHSTVDYYRILNELTNKKLGDKVNPPLLIANLNQAEIHRQQELNEWDQIAEIYITQSLKLIAAGAEAIAFCANTPHKIADDVQATLSVPLLHIVDATAKEIQKRKIDKVGLVGTKFTMEDPFFIRRLKDSNIDVRVPSGNAIGRLHHLVVDELANGFFNASNRLILRTEADTLINQGAEGIILGCTEFPILLTQSECPYPLFDTTRIHCEYITDFILEG